MKHEDTSLYAEAYCINYINSLHNHNEYAEMIGLPPYLKAGILNRFSMGTLQIVYLLTC